MDVSNNVHFVYIMYPFNLITALITVLITAFITAHNT